MHRRKHLAWIPVGAAVVDALLLGVTLWQSSGLQRWMIFGFGTALIAGVAVGVHRMAGGDLTALEEPDVYVEFDADLSLTPDAPFIVHNGGPGAVHDVQISAMENAYKLMTFATIQSIEDGGKRTPRFQILGPDGLTSDQLRTMESFLGGRLWPRNWSRFLHDRIHGGRSYLGGFEAVKIPFTVTFVRLGGRSGVRRHTLFFDPETRRAYVRAVTRA